MSQRPGPKPTPKKPLPKSPPKPRPTPRPNPDIPRPSPLPPRIPLPDDRGPVPPPRGPRGPADQPLPVPPRGPIPPRGQRGPADQPFPTPIPTPSSPTKRNPGKEIIVNFAGGQYGAVNDEAAEKIAKKYNLEITKRPEKNDPTPIYLFSVKGDVGSNLSGIRNESGVRYVEPNSRRFIPEVGPDPIIEWEDNTMRAALNGQPLPPKPMVQPSNTPKDLVSYGGLQGGVAGPSYQEAMAQQTYNNLMQQQMAFSAAQNGATFGNTMGTMPTQTIGTTPQQPTPIQMPVVQQNRQPTPFGQVNQKAMQNYQNLVGQGIANMQAMGRITPPGQLPNQPQRKPSTSSFQTPRPFG